MEESVFTKIIKGEIPAYKIYEDEKTLAFLDIDPVRFGHTLVVPKAEVEQYLDLADADYDALWKTIKKVGKQLREKMQTERVGLKIVGTDVPHVHVHLIPFNTGEKLYHDDTSPKPTKEEYEVLVEKLRLQ